MRQTPFDVASRLIEDFGDRAKFLADERADMALQSEDPTGYEHWCLVAKALALFTQPNYMPGVGEPTSRETPSPTVVDYVENQPQRQARRS